MRFFFILCLFACLALNLALADDEDILKDAKQVITEEEPSTDGGSLNWKQEEDSESEDDKWLGNVDDEELLMEPSRTSWRRCYRRCKERYRGSRRRRCIRRCCRELDDDESDIAEDSVMDAENWLGADPISGDESLMEPSRSSWRRCTRRCRRRHRGSRRRRCLYRCRGSYDMDEESDIDGDSVMDVASMLGADLIDGDESLMEPSRSSWRRCTRRCRRRHRGSRRRRCLHKCRRYYDLDGESDIDDKSSIMRGMWRRGHHTDEAVAGNYLNYKACRHDFKRNCKLRWKYYRHDDTDEE